MMECWNTGYEKRKRSILQKMLYLHLMMMPVRHPLSAFAQETAPILRENQYNYIRFDSRNPPFHCSIIPIVERSGAMLNLK
jgi:hypothetical protein